MRSRSFSEQCLFLFEQDSPDHFFEKNKHNVGDVKESMRNCLGTCGRKFSALFFFTLLFSRFYRLFFDIFFLLVFVSFLLQLFEIAVSFSLLSLLHSSPWCTTSTQFPMPLSSLSLINCRRILSNLKFCA